MDEGVRAAPGSRTLARMSGVSRGTATLAIRRLCEEGLLEASAQGGRTLIRMPGNPELPLSEESQPAWLALSRQVAEDIQRRRWGDDRDLPSVNRLREHYRVSRSTMVRALKRLHGRSIVERHGRGHRIALPRVPKGGGEVVLMARGSEDGAIGLIGPHQHEIISTLDVQCAKAGVSLVPSPCRYVNQDLLATEDWTNPATAASHSKSVLGFIVLTMAPDVDHGKFVRAVQKNGAPVVVIDELPERRTSFEPAPRSSPVLWIRAISDRLAGYHVASYLLSQGHKRIAYAYLGHDEHAQLRLCGMRRAFAEAGLPEGVSVVNCQPSQKAVDTWLGFQVETSARMVGAMRALLEEQLAGMPFERVAAVATRTGLGSLQDRYIASLETQGLPHLTLGAPVFAELSTANSATAWVLKGPELASAAMDFLLATGRRVPEDVSIMCFDDSEEAIARRLTVYSFNPGDAARAALGAILGPSLSPLRRGRYREMPVRGTVIARESVAAVG